MARAKGLIAIGNPSAGGEAPARNGDVIAGRGQATHVVKGIGMDHEKLLGAASGYAWFQSCAVVHTPYLTETDAERK
jgi:hypothetical protein